MKITGYKLGVQLWKGRPRIVVEYPNGFKQFVFPEYQKALTAMLFETWDKDIIGKFDDSKLDENISWIKEWDEDELNRSFEMTMDLFG